MAKLYNTITALRRICLRAVIVFAGYVLVPGCFCYPATELCRHITAEQYPRRTSRYGKENESYKDHHFRRLGSSQRHGGRLQHRIDRCVLLDFSLCQLQLLRHLAV